MLFGSLAHFFFLDDLAFEYLVCFILQYQIFIPMVNKVMQKHRISHQRYDVLICRIVKVRTFGRLIGVSLCNLWSLERY